MRSHDIPVATRNIEFAEDTRSGALMSEYVQLTQLHHDLDYMISALSAEASHDELLVARLKKRKLRLKDEIARMSGDLRTAPPSTL